VETPPGSCAAQRLESQDHQLALPGQDPVDLADDGVGVRGELQGMRQQHRIDAVTADGQRRRTGDDIGAAAEGAGRHHDLAARAAAGQELAALAPGPDLQELPAEHIFERLAQKLRLGRQQDFSQRHLPKSTQGGIAVRHGINYR